MFILYLQLLKSKFHILLLGTLQTAFPKSDLTVADNALYRWLKDASKRKKVPAKESPAGPSAKSKKPAPKKSSEQ